MEKQREESPVPAISWPDLVAVEYAMREEGLVSRSIVDSDLGAVERLVNALAEVAAAEGVLCKDAIAACAYVLCFLVGNLLASAAEQLWS